MMKLIVTILAIAVVVGIYVWYWWKVYPEIKYWHHIKGRMYNRKDD